MGAILKTMEIAALKQRYFTVQQGAREPFLQFVEKPAAKPIHRYYIETTEIMLNTGLIEAESNSKHKIRGHIF